MEDRMTIQFAPLAMKNPYQKNLAHALYDLGADVLNYGQNSDGKPPADGLQSEEPPDILHLHWTHPYTKPDKPLKTIVKWLRFLNRVAALKSSGTKIVWTIHNLKSHESVYPRLELFFSRRLANTADALIVHCESSKQLVSDAYNLAPEDRTKMFVTRHANYIGCYPDGISREEARETLGLGMGDRIFLFLGQIRGYKGLSRLIEEFEKLGAPSLKLVIAGKPKSRRVFEGLQAQIENDDRIMLRPTFVPENEIQVYMNACDVVVLPFTDILTSGSAILAMSFRKPVIAPRIGCMPELLDHQESLLYAPQDKEGLAKALSVGSNLDLDQLQRAGMKNHRRVQDATWKKMAEETYQVYRHVSRADEVV